MVSFTVIGGPAAPWVVMSAIGRRSCFLSVENGRADIEIRKIERLDKSDLIYSC
jgi:hypothetical protein